MLSKVRFQLALLTIVITPQLACSQMPAPARGETAIPEALIRRHVNVIADDSMLGRNTPSRGLELTAAYVAAQFKRLGLKPGGDSGMFIQRYPISISAGGGRGTPAPALGFDPGSAPNSVGILPGTDPALRDEYIVVSAHFDLVGMI